MWTPPYKRNAELTQRTLHIAHYPEGLMATSPLILFLTVISLNQGIGLVNLVEEDEEALKRELKEAFRIYDKECNG